MNLTPLGLMGQQISEKGDELRRGMPRRPTTPIEADLAGELEPLEELAAQARVALGSLIQATTGGPVMSPMRGPVVDRAPRRSSSSP